MGKIYKRKRKSCCLCKPHKTGHAKRWKAKELQTRKIKQKEAKDGLSN